MNLTDHINLLKRNLLAVVLIAVVTSVLTLGIGLRQETPNGTGTLFLSIGAGQGAFKTEESDTKYGISAAGQFAETVHGWLKNPAILESVAEKVGHGVEINAYKQEKQNIVVNYSSSSQEDSQKTANAIEAEIVNKIRQYDNETGSDFKLAVFTAHYAQAGSKLPVFVLLGILLGIFLGAGLSYLYEFFFDKVSAVFQVEGILNRKSHDIISQKDIKANAIPYLTTLIDNMPNRYNILAGVNFIPETLEKCLAQHDLKSEYEIVEFPKSIGRVAKMTKENLVVVVKLGKTRKTELSKIKNYLPGNYILVVLT